MRKDRGGSRISGKGVHLYKAVGDFSLADFISFFLNIPWKYNLVSFYFHRIFKNGGQGGGSSESPEPPLDPPLRPPLNAYTDVSSKA